MSATLLNRPPALNFELGETADMLRASVEYEIGAGTSEIRRMLIGRELYKETA